MILKFPKDPGLLSAVLKARIQMMKIPAIK